jgi:hypothetical protein
MENLSTALVAATVNSTDTTITLTSTAKLASAGFIKIGTETISYPNINGNQLINCARGQNNTTAAAHAIGDTVTVQNLPCINVWPTPNSPGNQYTFVYYRLRRMQDAGTGVNEQDIPFRLLPALIAGLAFQISVKKAPERAMALKAEYEEQWLMASTEDRDKAPLRLVPRNNFYYR